MEKGGTAESRNATDLAAVTITTESSATRRASSSTAAAAAAAAVTAEPKPSSWQERYKSSKVDRPRYDKLEKLLHRFYEPLVLLYVLDPTRGAHLTRPTSEWSGSTELGARELRRTFLDKLSYVCDYETGGLTVTAIALQKRPDKIIFTVAANKNIRPRALEFLRSTLSLLKACSALTVHECSRLQEELVLKCIELSESRLRTYWRFLRKPLQGCIRALKQSRNSHG